MNYLAHILLSGDDKKVQFGNFIGDAIKGSAYNKYPKQIAEGIIMHRAIDEYTDNHPAVRSAIVSLRPYFGRYSAVVLDIYFDYMLASHFKEFSGVPLRRYTRRFYLTTICLYRYLPERIRRFIWHFIATDRLGKYASTAGIKESLDIMTAVHHMDISSQEAIDYLTEHEGELLEVFRQLFRDLQTTLGK